MSQARQSLDIRPLGDSAISVILGETVNQATRSKVQAFSRAIKAAAIPGVIEMVPTYLAVLVHYDPLVTSYAELAQAIRALSRVPVAEELAGSRHWTLPLCVDGPDHAPDLAHVADWAGISPQDVLADILATTQVVYMLGFAPGQPYLGDLPDRLAVPRRESPVRNIPVGAVLIATGKTVIYPVVNPTGWHVVGRTPVRLFDPVAADPVLLAPGDQVTFEPVGSAEFLKLEKAIAAGELDPRKSMLG